MGRILGIDYGDVRIGLALTDPLKIIASPFRTIQNRNNDFIIKELGSIINEKKIETLVIGLPIGLNNQETIQTKKVRIFADLIKILEIPIYFQDERLSSISAKKSLIVQNIKTGSNKSMIDKAAAAIFLQQFIDTKN
jgi:putative Holliday junction resolvase